MEKTIAPDGRGNDGKARETSGREEGDRDGEIRGVKRECGRTIRFRVSCGSGHVGHVVADLASLPDNPPPPPRRELSHLGVGVSTGFGWGGRGDTNRDSKRPKKEEEKKRRRTSSTMRKTLRGIDNNHVGR